MTARALTAPCPICKAETPVSHYYCRGEGRGHALNPSEQLRKALRRQQREGAELKPAGLRLL